ncbi:MAG: S49 family peptidase, partial [Pseudomonadota bacterium]
DEDIRAVVLRVDSPGGSAFASEVMRDELVRLKDAGKPVVVSMGSLAASGGYWISASADEIWAAPTTLTGSIGVFGFVPTFENAMAELGVSTDGVGTTPLSSAASAGLGPLPQAYGEVIQASVESVYTRFLNLVAEGRGMSTVAVDEIAQGRVWIGDKALELSLVDKLGTIDDAIAAAAARAELEDYDVVGITQQKSRFEMFLSQIAGEGGSDIGATTLFGAKPSHAVTVSKILSLARSEAAFYASFNDPGAVYVRCLECAAN